MRFRDDRRGVTVQVGAVLLFATIVIGLATYQATVVPAQNADVEYQHSQQALAELADVRNALLGTAATGTARPASVTLGTQYPSRALLLNPPPAAGTFATGTYENDTISVANVRALDVETADFINGTWTAATKHLAYQPDYHEYDNAPNVVFGATVLSNHYPSRGTTVPLTDQLLFDESTNTITLVALNGSLSTSRPGSVSVTAAPVSAPYNQVQVTNETAGNVTVTVPTKLDAATLRNATTLGDQGAVVTVEPASGDRVRVVLEPGTYTLQTAKLGVGSDVAPEDAAYLTLVGSDDNLVTVEARDRFNNPVGGVDVTVDDASLVADDDGVKTTSADGRVSFTHTGSGRNATASIRGGGRPELEVEFDGRTGTGDDVDGGTLLAWNTSRIESENSDLGMTCWEGNTTCEYTRSDPGVDTVSLSAAFSDGRAYANVDFAANDTTVVSGLDPGSDTSSVDGSVSTNATVDGAGTGVVYATSVRSEDTLRLRAAPSSGDTVGSDPSVSITGISSQGNSGKFDVSWTAGANGDGDLATGDVTANPVFGGQTPTQSIDVDGENAEGTTGLDGERGTWYFVTVTVTDEDGRTDTATQFYAS